MISDFLFSYLLFNKRISGPTYVSFSPPQSTMIRCIITPGSPQLKVKVCDLRLGSIGKENVAFTPFCNTLSFQDLEYSLGMLFVTCTGCPSTDTPKRVPLPLYIENTGNE